MTEDGAVAALARERLRGHAVEVQVAPSSAAARSLMVMRRAEDSAYDLLCMDVSWLTGEGGDLLGETIREPEPPKLVLLARTGQAALRVVSLTHVSDADDYGQIVATPALTDENGEIAAFCSRHGLSRTESALLALAVQGFNNDEAAAMLRCHRCTIGTYWNRIFRKTQARGQRDVIGKLLRARYVAPR